MRRTSRSFNMRMRFLHIVGVMLFVLSCKQNNAGFSGGQKSEPRQPPPKKETTPPPTSDATPTPQPAPQPAQPLPQNAIVQGKFTVWAVPPNPAAGESYDIHVRVTLPTGLQNYDKSDLSGDLVGTDGYYQGINGTEGTIYNKASRGFANQKFIYTPGSPTAELIMVIPGAKKGVDDTLNVKSIKAQDRQIIRVHFN